MGLFGRKDTGAKVGDMLAKAAGGPVPGKPGKRTGLAGKLARMNIPSAPASAPVQGGATPSATAPAPRPSAGPATSAKNTGPQPARAPAKTRAQGGTPPRRAPAPARPSGQGQPQPVAKAPQRQSAAPRAPASSAPRPPTSSAPRPAPASAPRQAPASSAPRPAPATAPRQAPAGNPSGAAPQRAPNGPRPEQRVVATLDPEVVERLEALEQGMSGLKNVQDLSELLATKYNPFLDLEEEVFEDKYSPRELLQAQAQKRRPAWARPSPGTDDPLADFDPIPTTPMQIAAPHPETAPRPEPPQTEPRKIVAPSSFNSPTADNTMYAGKRHTANARESFLAMHWFTYLSEGTSPSIIFLYLDYYRYVGWIDAEAHDWLVKLAEGVATRKQDAKWEDFGMDVQKLSAQHLRNLRFIDKLLGTTLQHGEADYLRQTADMLLMED